MAAGKRASAGDQIATVVESIKNQGTSSQSGGASSQSGGSEESEPNQVDPRETGPISPDERYQARHRLGQGGMGDIMLCFDQVLRRHVAMKSLRHRGRDDDRIAAARFMREVLIQGQLEHPSIVPVYDLAIGPDGDPHFTMKRVRGQTLRSILKRLRRGDAKTAERFPQRKLLLAFGSVCMAVSFAHSRGVIHRDLKPENIMLGDFGEVYVLDWGVAKVLRAEDLPAYDAPPTASGENADADDDALTAGAAPQTAAGITLGTPGYMAPEQICGDSEGTDACADIYALGAILFEILTLQKLHEGSDVDSILTSTALGADARAHARAPDRDVPPELEAICVKATDMVPDRRYASARDLHAALERYLNDDRDVELRRAMASEHARAAAEAAERALTAETGDPDERRRGLREAGRALALDPANEAAARALMRLLTEPPREMPPDARLEIETERFRRTRDVARLSAIGFASLAGYIPLLLWMGVQDWIALAVLYGLLGAFVAVSIWVARLPRPRTGHVFLLLVISTLAIGATSPVLGPFVLVPGFAAVNIMAFILHLDRHHGLALAIGLLAVAVPGLLQWAGVLPPAYAFGEAGMSILPRMVSLRHLPTMTFLVISSFGTIITSVLLVDRVQRALLEAELRLHLHAWQLRQLVPQQGALQPKP